MSIIQTIKIYRCDNCGKRAKWGRGWRVRYKMHDTWDEQLHACSAKCAASIDEFRPKRRKHA